MRKQFLFLAVFSAIILSACNKDNEIYSAITVNDYAPQIVGKYITYDLDSTVFINFGTKDTVRKYQVKLVVDAQITDNLNRTAYRIIRYIRPTAASPWNADNTFMYVPTEFGLEFVENNMRYIKLKGPVRDGLTWKGNIHIDSYSIGSNVKYLADWDYTYENVNTAATVGAFNFDSTLNVNQRDEVIGDPSNPNSYHEINFGAETYAWGIGMVYRNFLHVEYQPPTPGRGGYKQGYGVKMTMIDHN